MIGQLIGTLLEKKPPFLLIDVNGVGYEVQASMTTIYELPDINSKIKLLTHFVAREDAQQLYGFSHEKERWLFRELIKVSGVGPKLGLAILSGMDVNSFSECIANRNIARLVKLPGVGKKTAERLTIELQDKLNKDQTIFEISANVDAKSDAISALVALGYKMLEAQKAISKIFQPELDSEALIRLALQAQVK